MFHQQPKLFIDPKIDDPIDDFNLRFSDYIKKCRSIITKHRLDLKQSDYEKIITANSPFELYPTNSNHTRYGALLIHGLFDSPFLMKDIGAYLQTQGVLTKAILLPGHGTVPGALLNINKEQWLQAVRYGIAQLTKEVDHIFLIGFSTGGSLALAHVLQNHTSIAGLILLSPAIKIRSTFDFTANWHHVISKQWKRAAWLTIDPEETIDYVRYLSMPFNPIYQVYQLSQQIKPAATLPCPLLLIASENDITVSSPASIDYFHQHADSHSRLLLYSNKINASLDDRMIIRPSAHPEIAITDLSHNAVPVAPDNPHYGIEGDYPYASHISSTKNTYYGEFSKFSIQLNEWLYQLKFRDTHLQRLTFNPDFSFMSKLIQEFMQDND